MKYLKINIAVEKYRKDAVHAASAANAAYAKK